MSKKSCILYPEVNGEPSRLYKDFLQKSKLERPVANYLYAAYITSNMADKMDSAGYQRNEQGQHNAQDVLAFIDFAKIQNQVGNLTQLELQLGAIDSNGNRVDYKDAEQALNKADKFNDTYPGFIASVVQHGDVYNIVVNEKDSRNHLRGVYIKQYLQVWDIYKQVFNGIGIDISNVPSGISDIVNANNPQMIQSLQNFQYIPISSLYAKDALLLFFFNKDIPQVQKLVTEFGSLEDAANFIDSVNKGAITPTSKQKALVLNAVQAAKKFKGLDLNLVTDQVSKLMKQILNSSPEEPIAQTLHKLNKKYKIGINEIHKINDNINTLSEAATEAVFTLERQVRQLERERGNNAEGRKIDGIINSLLKEIDSKKYYSGITRFLAEAKTQIAEVDNLINKAKQTGTTLDQIFDRARILKKTDDIRTAFYDLVSALADESLVIDESISQSDIANIRKAAKDLKDFFDKKDKLIKELTEGTMISLMQAIIGDSTPDGQAIINAVRMAASDSSILNYLYSIGRASNPVIGAMGSIIRNAQDNRNGIINDMSLRIKRATNKLYKSGSNSEFMYESDGEHIISDIDWVLYNKVRKEAIKGFYKQGLRGFDLKQAIENWEDNNTEDRVVDKTNGRTEKVPDKNYRKPFPQLTAAQQEYYDEMMQLKGEIGSLLPAYAQRQYTAPQLRRKMIDALAHANNIRDVWKAVRNKVANIVTVREDDQNYASNGVIDGDNYGIVESDINNERLKQIPIFFVNKLKDSDELLKNFSTGLQALAGTAINYDAMNSVVDVVEFVGNFVKEQVPRPDQKEADLVETATVRVIKDLRKQGRNYNTDIIVDSFINQFIYGKYRDNSGGKAFNKFIDSIVSYTSFKGLATNVKGAFANYLMGEFQMLIEAGAGEFYNFKDYIWAHSKLFGNAGVTGELWDILNETRNSKSSLLADMFDPEQENFRNKSHMQYHKSMFRKLMAHDLSFIGYGSGEYLIHYVNMYSVLHHQKVKLNGKIISLYDAFEVTQKQDGVAELRLKQGVTRIDGRPVTQEFIDGVRRKIRYVNQTCHGAMNTEDKGIIYQKWYGRLAMNFRQWMVEHYSRRFRGLHFDALLGENREGYYVSLYKLFENDKSKEAREQGDRLKALLYWTKDLVTFNWRCRTNWHNMTEMQKYNCKRAMMEALLLIGCCGLSFALGDPDRHKKEFWRRWWIYQTRRMIMDTEASMPMVQMPFQFMNIMQSPFGGISTLNSLLYILYGFHDIFETIETGDHKGENRYLRNITKYALPVVKDFEQMQNMSTDDAIFKVFEMSPTNH